METKRLQVLSVLSLLLERSASHFLPSRPHAVDDDEDAAGVLDAFREVSRTVHDNAHARIDLRPRTKFPLTSLDPEDDPTFEDAPDLVPGTGLGAGLGSACSHDGQCNGALGFICLRSQVAPSACACSPGTPVHVNDGGHGKCVRAKAMYESCMSDQECSYGNPNVQCVDFLCYCPLPFEITDSQRCLLPAIHNNLGFAIGPAGIMALALLMLGGVYTYQKFYRKRSDSASTGDVRDTASTCTPKRRKSPTRVHRKTEPSLSLRRAVEDRGKHGPGHFWDTRPGARYIDDKTRRASIQMFDSFSAKLWSSSVNRTQPSKRGSRRIRQSGRGRLPPVLEETTIHVAQKDGTSSIKLEKSDQQFRGFRRQGKPLSPSPTEPELFLAKDDKLRNVLGVDQVVINIEPREHFGRTSADASASAIPALPRPPPAMPLPRPSSPPPTLWRHPEAIIPESTGYSSTKDLQYRLGLQASQAAPLPELRRSLQRQATSTEAIHKNDTDVQEELSPSMVDTARQVSESLTWDIKFRTRAPVSHHPRDTRLTSCHAEPQSRSLKTSEYSGEFNSKVDLLLDCDAKENSTPDGKEVSRMADIQSSEISIQYTVSLRKVSETTFPGHADAPFRHCTTPDKPEAELLRTVQKSSRSFWGLPMGVAKHVEQVHQLRDATFSHRAKGHPRPSEGATTRLSQKWSMEKTHDQDLTYTAGTERFEKAAQGQEIGQKLEKPNDIGTYSSFNTMKTAVTIGTGGASNKKCWQKTKQKRSGTLALSKGSLATFFINTIQKSMNTSIKQSAPRNMGAFGTRRRKGRFVMSSRDDTATESSETKPPKNRKQRISQKLEASTCHKVTSDTGAICCGPKQMRLDRSSNLQLMDGSAVSAVSHAIRVTRRRDSDVRDVDLGPLKVPTKNVSDPTLEPGDSNSLAKTMLPRSFAFRSTQFISDTIPQSQWQTMKLQQNVDTEEKPFAQLLADIKDGDCPKVETTATGTMITTKAEDESKLNTALINKSRDSKAIENAPRRRSLDANEGTSKFSVAETTSLGNEVPLSTAVLPIPITSDEASQKTSHNLDPFCRSEEGPLIMSESTSLSFVSSGSSVSELHRSTDLAGISRLMTLEAPTKKTGDGKFPTSDDHHVTSDFQTCDFKGRLSRSVQVGLGGNRTSRVSTNKTESSAATEHLWNKSVLRVVLMGNHHYIRERTASLQRDKLALPSTLDETQYIWNQIMNSPNSGAQTPIRPFGLPSNPTVPKNPKVKGSGHIVNKQTTGRSERFSCSEEACSESQVFAPQKLKNLALMNHPLVGLMKPMSSKSLERSSAHFPKQMSSSAARDQYVFQDLLAPDISDAAPQLQLNCRTVTQELSTGAISKDARGNVLVTLSAPEALGISEKLEQGSCTTTLQQACVKGCSQAQKLPLPLPMCEQSPTSVQEQLLLPDAPYSPTAIQQPSPEVLSFSSNMDTAVGTTVTPSRETLESCQFSKSLSLSSRRNRELSTRILQGTCFESMYSSILHVESTVARDNIVPVATVHNFPTPLPLLPSFEKQHPTFHTFTSGASDTITEQPSDISSLLVKPRVIQSEKKTLLKHLGLLCTRQPKQWRQSRHKMASLPKPRNLKSLRPSVHRHTTCRNSSPVVLWHQPVVSLKPKLRQQPESKPQQRAETSPMTKFQGLRGDQEQTHLEWPRPMALRRPESADPIANRGKQSPYFFGDYDTEWEPSLLPDSTKLDWSDDEGATPQ